MTPPAASPGETFPLWFGCLLHCPGADILVGEEDTDVCPGGLLRHGGSRSWEMVWEPIRPASLTCQAIIFSICCFILGDVPQEGDDIARRMF